MIEHPCINGLSPTCFKAYPGWFTKALAYKFLRVLLPKQVTPILKVGLERPLIGPRSTLPGGVELPPGSIVPPDLSVPENWIPWFHFIFTTDDDPRTLFPVDWIPGDPLPLEVKLPEGYSIPSSWTPKDPPHPVFLSGYNPFPTPPEEGPAPPLYIHISEPGPAHRPSPTPPDAWTQLLSNSYWQAWYLSGNGGYTMTWDGVKWRAVYGGPTECGNWPALNPKTGTTWAVGYRPAKVRITFTGGTPPIKIGLCDTAGNVLGHNLACVSPQVIDLNFAAGNDIKRLNTYNILMYITNIEFK
jgi:hypothetical protein